MKLGVRCQVSGGKSEKLKVKSEKLGEESQETRDWKLETGIRGQAGKNYIFCSLKSKVCRLWSVVCILLFFIIPCSASSLCLNDLLSESKRYDGQKIEVTGEAIGFPIKKKNGWFINVDIGGGVIGVFTKKLPKIEHYGNYKEKGDVVKVQGIFYSTCKEHRGETDLHSQGIEVIKRGETIPHPIKKANVIAAITLSLLAILLVLLYRRLSGKTTSP